MSYDIYLCEPGTDTTITFDAPHDIIGGTHAVGGTDEAWLNVTYNYSEFYRKTIDREKGIRWLYGKTGAECIEPLQKAIAELGVEPDRDYWAATP